MGNVSFHFAHRFDQVSGSAIREIFKVIAQPGMISFAGGNPAPDALPDDVVRKLCDEVIREKGKVLLQYGATEGYAPFVESLKAYVEEQLHCEIPAVLPVTGSTQAMDLLCKALIDPGDCILVDPDIPESVRQDPARGQAAEDRRTCRSLRNGRC